MFVAPLVGDGVQEEEPGIPRLLAPLSGILPLGLLQEELLLCGSVLVLVHYSAGHVLPQPGTTTNRQEINPEMRSGHAVLLVSTRGEIQRHALKKRVMFNWYLTYLI